MVKWPNVIHNCLNASLGWSIKTYIVSTSAFIKCIWKCIWDQIWKLEALQRFEAVSPSVDIASPLSFLYANYAKSTFGGVSRVSGTLSALNSVKCSSHLTMFLLWLLLLASRVITIWYQHHDTNIKQISVYTRLTSYSYILELNNKHNLDGKKRCR